MLELKAAFHMVHLIQNAVPVTKKQLSHQNHFLTNFKLKEEKSMHYTFN